ncbi:MAG: lamin tail domain-containing protein [Chloroflexaceae bacterium]|jgi:hypothetical protein|nr:lamin tail domain-containing protein [Chloroflexaceae bacterium]
MTRVRWLLLVLFALSFTPLPAAAQTTERCFSETGFCISGPIRAYWERNGGLAVFGFPITAQATETVEGRTLQVQWFERDRLEIQADGTVTAGRLGVERLEQLGTPWQQGPNEAAKPGCAAFPQTGYQVCGAFVDYWRRNGGLERFGYPVTPEFQTTIEGKTLSVQYFERRRFEFHPDQAPAFQVLLGLLGREVLNGRGAAPQPPAVPQPPAPPQQLPPSYNNCQADPNAASAPNFPVRIVGVDKGREIVTLQNVSNEAVSLDGWIMCSIRGNQQHPIGGTLAPNETREFPGPQGTIWSNNDKDDGALYNPQGQLVSYWNDPNP